MKTATFPIRTERATLYTVEFEVDLHGKLVVNGWKAGHRMSEAELRMWVSAFGKDRILSHARGAA